MAKGLMDRGKRLTRDEMSNERCARNSLTSSCIIWLEECICYFRGKTRAMLDPERTSIQSSLGRFHVNFGLTDRIVRN